MLGDLSCHSLFPPLASNGCHVKQSNQGLLAVSPGERVPLQAGGELSTSLNHRRRPLNLHRNQTLLHYAITIFFSYFYL